MKKIGSEKKYVLDDFNVKIGTIDKKNTNVFYTEYSTYLKNIDDNKINNIKKGIENVFNKNYYDFVNNNLKIVDIDVNKSLTDGIPSFLTVKVFNKTKNICEFNNINNEIYNTIKTKIIPDIYDLFQNNNVSLSKTKK